MINQKCLYMLKSLPMLSIPFTKMHGAGNDYLYLNLFDPEVSKLIGEIDHGDLAVKISDRHFGVGGDGMVLLAPGDEAAFQMIMYNADGTESEMCGNAIRCVAKLIRDLGLNGEDEFPIQTKSGIKIIHWIPVDDQLQVRVNMGVPELQAEAIPSSLTGPEILDYSFDFGEMQFDASLINMGNPHFVTFAANIDELDLAKLGPVIENSSFFPQRINSEFVELEGENQIFQRTWERGSGETLACGTGASAVAVAAILTHRAQSPIRVRLRGGTLQIEWAGRGEPLYMTGPAAVICQGTYDYHP